MIGQFAGTLTEIEKLKQIKIKKILENDKEQRSEMRRHMSLHVGSRWYRAPEISIIEKQYD